MAVVYVNGMQMGFSACGCISRNHRRLTAAGTKESYVSIPNHRGVATEILLEDKKICPTVIRVLAQLQQQGFLYPGHILIDSALHLNRELLYFCNLNESIKVNVS